MKRFNNMFVCIKNGDFDFEAVFTLAFYKKNSVEKLRERYKGATDNSWKELKKYGWRCKRVDLVMEEPKK